MADFVIKSGDRRPSIQATLAIAGLAVNLTEADHVDFIMRSENGGTIKVNAAAEVVSAGSGVVRYDWAPGDTDTPGKYQAEWEVNWPDDQRQTFPTQTYHSVEVLADLDDDVDA